MRVLRPYLLRVLDLLIQPAVLPAALLLRRIRRSNIINFPLSRRLFLRYGIYPIVDHYYDPLVLPRHLRQPTTHPRHLPAIDWDLAGQQAFLAALAAAGYQHELRQIPLDPDAATPNGYYYNNPFFASGDAEVFYSILRHNRPRRLIEVGAGFSTRLARRALARNQQDDPAYCCEHVCIEPYEQPTLEALGATVLRLPVEQVPLATFTQLQAGDMLFIDSSHIIRPQGDLLYLYLEVLPCLQPGVLIHIHDIFSPASYPAAWLTEHVMFFNEQYLLEALLSGSQQFRILAALNYLYHHAPQSLFAVCPILQQQTHQPGSFWLCPDHRRRELAEREQQTHQPGSFWLCRT